MSKRKAHSIPESGSDQPRIKGTNLTLEYVIENLYVGRTSEELIKQHPELSAEAIANAKKQLLFLAHYENRTDFYQRMRVRHLIAALRPHPVVEKICDAFDNIPLGGGMSLQQLLCADCYGEDESGRPLIRQEYLHLRTLDEINHWQGIKLADLDGCWAFAHCDAESFRYYIPARMVHDMVYAIPVSGEVIWQLEHESVSERWSLLSQQQREAIASYLWNGLSAFRPKTRRLPDDLQTQVEETLERHWFGHL